MLCTSLVRGKRGRGGAEGERRRGAQKGERRRGRRGSAGAKGTLQWPPPCAGGAAGRGSARFGCRARKGGGALRRLARCLAAHELVRSEEHTSELQSPCNLVCRLLLEKKNNTATLTTHPRSL